MSETQETALKESHCPWCGGSLAEEARETADQCASQIREAAARPTNETGWITLSKSVEKKPPIE